MIVKARRTDFPKMNPKFKKLLHTIASSRFFITAAAWFPSARVTMRRALLEKNESRHERSHLRELPRGQYECALDPKLCFDEALNSGTTEP